MLRGSKATPETRMKMSLSKKGVKRPDLSILFKGKKKSKAHRENIRLSKLGKQREPFSEEWLSNMSKAQKGKKHRLSWFDQVSGGKNVMWKGDKVGYVALHSWVRRHLGRPNKCEFCGLSEDNPNKFEWANKSGDYLRDLSDWIRLCKSCHNLFDRKRKKLKQNA